MRKETFGLKSFDEQIRSTPAIDFRMPVGG